LNPTMPNLELKRRDVQDRFIHGGV
jgi:hypothetical protein